ncbi:uncharacterized protein DUF4064 [Streptohalobacillus salinus]|uniref:Uncharacterized protein DUF4064 n=1 Tax=Streptohalobacillus salinus TaxID=621096 RepID=A0A2V3W6L1_9BACI|nr:DUF4064 domain-containing protein [Streptohalobacillus salinus]PXW89216.1 uncharacterized protein DUF4064 [Streptohalobacillus salinus]
MISRRFETILIILGIAVFAFFGVQGVSMLVVHNDEEAAMELYESYQGDLEADQEETYDLPEFSVFVENLQSGGIIILVLSAMTIITGIISIVFLKKNLKPKLVGILLLVSGAVVAILGFAPAMFGSLLYMASGVLVLFKKPKVQVE